MKFYLTMLFLYTLNTFGQTSIYTELVSNILPKEYLIKGGKPSKIIVTVQNNPSGDSYVDKWIYEFETSKKVIGKLYRDGNLSTTSRFTLDSIGRRISISKNLKHKSLGWKKTNTNYVFTHNSKELLFLNLEGDVKYRMLVQYDSLKSPVRITSFNSQNKFDGVSTAKYDYISGTFRYRVYRADRSIVVDKEEFYNHEYLIERNDNDDITEMYWPTARKGSGVVHKFNYKYDKLGNWIRMKKTLVAPGDKRVLSVTKRKITYSKD